MRLVCKFCGLKVSSTKIPVWEKGECPKNNPVGHSFTKQVIKKSGGKK